VVLFVVLGCANPRPPGGGPRDTTPPSVVDTRPSRDSVNVSTDIDHLHLSFSEFVDRGTLPGALSVTPEVEGRLRFDWSNQAVDVELPSGLRDNTTYIVSLSTDLSDANGVALEEPITFAFSTGPRINQGQIRGRVVRARRGEPAPQVDVFAYATADTANTEPRPFPERPAYRTQTGEDGTFELNYLPARRSFFVVALRDNNRNRRPDPAERIAAPPRPAVPATRAAEPVPVPWVITSIDTVGPSVQQVQPLSRQRIRLRFDEPVRLGERTPGAWRLRDSTAGTTVPVRSVFEAAGRNDAILLRTDEMRETRHALFVRPPLVTDTLGQGASPDTVRFQGVARADTTRTRFRSFVPEGLPRDTTDARLLLPTVTPGVRFNQPPDTAQLRRMVTVQDTAGTPRSYDIRTDDGRSFRLVLDPPLASDALVEVAVDLRLLAGPDSTVRGRFRRLSNRQLGALEGRVPLADTTWPASPEGREDADGSSDSEGGSTVRDSMVVELQAEEASPPVAPRQQTVSPGSTFVFSRLPEGAFHFRAFLDRDGTGRWARGQVRPYEPPDPITWGRELVDSRPRWTTVLPAPLRVPVLRVVPEAPPQAPADTTSRDSVGLDR